MVNNEKKQKTIAKRQDAQKQQFLEFLEEIGGNVQMACRKVGIGRQTYYRWRDDDSTFKHRLISAKQRGREKGCDMAESALVGLIADKNFPAIKYYLEHNHPEYMQPVRYREHPREKPPDPQHVPTLNPQTIEEQKRVVVKKYEDELREIIVKGSSARNDSS